MTFEQIQHGVDYISEDLLKPLKEQKAQQAGQQNKKTKPAHDPVNHPSHYTDRVPGIECIDVVENFDFCLGGAIKYIWRAGLKDPTKEIEDLKKARWLLDREIKRLEKETKE